jgi:hypothetical protein
VSNGIIRHFTHDLWESYPHSTTIKYLRSQYVVLTLSPRQVIIYIYIYCLQVNNSQVDLLFCQLLHTLAIPIDIFSLFLLWDIIEPFHVNIQLPVENYNVKQGYLLNIDKLNLLDFGGNITHIIVFTCVLRHDLASKSHLNQIITCVFSPPLIVY